MSLDGVLATLGAALGATSPLEAAAAVLGIVYVVLMIGQHRSGWVAGGVSTAVFLFLFARAALYMQALLNAYYVLVAVYGWWAWRREDPARVLRVSRASLAVQLGGAAAVVVASAASGAWLAREMHSSDPYLDSLTTWASVFATWLAARKHLDSWAWWFAIDALIAYLCWRQALYAAMILYILYLALVVIGWRSWKADMRRTDEAAGRATP